MSRVMMVAVVLWVMPLAAAFAAYHHGGDTDSDVVLEVYPEIKGTKLDSCALCHSGGQYEKKEDVWVELGSCQWCHFSYGYDESGDIDSTLNVYGKAYRAEGGSENALKAIAGEDSDMDGFANDEEIAALRFPGNENDDPAKVVAPYRVLSLEELEGMAAHSQVMLMNTHKSGDFYAEYTGVPVSLLLDNIGILDSASGITVFAPDGWAQYHPLDFDPDPSMYHVYGIYPGATYFYAPEADQEKDMDFGWCDYSSPALATYENGQIIDNPGGLQMLLAYGRDGYYLDPGKLTDDNKLDGEGPFRVVPPQKLVGPPDQSVLLADRTDFIWPFDENADHNAGYATRSATIIKVEPLPEGTTDIDALEAGWDYVEEGKILVYGAIVPLDTILQKISGLQNMIRQIPRRDFKHRFTKTQFLAQLALLEHRLVRERAYFAPQILRYLSGKFDGCVNNGAPDHDDWLEVCQEQLQVYWSLHEQQVLLQITD